MSYPIQGRELAQKRGTQIKKKKSTNGMREHAEKSSSAWSILADLKVSENERFSSLIDGNHRLYMVQATQSSLVRNNPEQNEPKKRQATKFVARLDNPRRRKRLRMEQL